MPMCTATSTGAGSSRGQGSSPLAEIHTYAGAQHGFNNDTTPRHDEKAAALAWKRTVDFFNTHVRG